MCDLDGCDDTSNLPPIEVDPQQRRAFIKGMASLPLATVLAFPELTQAAAARLESVSLQLSNGRTVSGALALPVAIKAPAVMLIHEWWGLNDQIKSVAADFASRGYVALAVDLYNGKVASEPAQAKSLMKAVDSTLATETLNGWNTWLRGNSRTTDKLGTVGWCFGGGWSLNASLSASVDATVIYYGNVAVEAQRLRSLKGPVLGHFATEDGWIDAAMVSGFEKAMQEASRANQLEVYWYEANHAFANPTSARYDEPSAALSWQRTTEFFAKHLA